MPNTDVMADASPADPAAPGRLPLMAAADIQDHLMTATHDLERLQTLLADACEVLMRSFHSANDRVCALRASPAQGADAAELERTCADLSHHLAVAITALQFQDMGSQLIDHTHRRLRSCAERVAREAMGDDEDGVTVVEEAPLRPNPVTQDEMDAGSIELF